MITLLNESNPGSLGCHCNPRPRRPLSKKWWGSQVRSAERVVLQTDTRKHGQYSGGYKTEPIEVRRIRRRARRGIEQVNGGQWRTDRAGQSAGRSSLEQLRELAGPQKPWDS